jgi:hypothetical protein
VIDALVRLFQDERAAIEGHLPADPADGVDFAKSPQSSIA